MKPIFTVHEGEYLVGAHLEQTTDYNIWIPTKDTGEDMLVTNPNRTKNASIQVKFSKDFLVTHNKPEMFDHILCSGWWNLTPSKIKNSRADLWVFVLFPFLRTDATRSGRQNSSSNAQYVIVRPLDLYERLMETQGNKSRFHVYLSISRNNNRCLQTRGLRASNSYFVKDLPVEPARDFSECLNNWQPLHELLES